MNQRKINVIVSNQEPKEGNRVYFLVGQEIHKGTALQCEKCKKWCSANSVTILDFPAHIHTVTVFNGMTHDELGYQEETDLTVCSDC